jgi:hypothetical protein
MEVGHSMENFDWVTALASCSVGVVFETLKQQVQEDVETRQGRLPKADHYGFRFVSGNDTFSVLVEGNKIHKSVAFSQKGKIIAVRGDSDGPNFDATLTLSDTGDCKVKIDGQERELWQMRKKALEKLFFDDY